MKIILAIDKFKGCLSSAEANAAAEEGVLMALPSAEVISIPVSDGGEGWLEAFHAAIGGELIDVKVCDPLMRVIHACYLRKGDTAIIEMAKACGLSLLAEEERNPLVATSYGTGQLVTDAVEHGCKNIIVGLGGSATSDAGQGMLKALTDTFDSHLEALKNIRFTIAIDVTNPLYGPQGAAHVFAPQKGATPEMVEELDLHAQNFAEASARLHGYDCSSAAGAGAAGGLGYAFLQYLHADSHSGIELLLDAVNFDSIIADVDLVITGEGSSDSQTLMGKLPMGILGRSSSHQVPVYLIAGRISERRQLLDAGFALAECINPPGLPLEEALRPEVAKNNIRKLVRNLILSKV